MNVWKADQLIAKLLAERLEKVIHGLVDRQQTTFIKGRQIVYAILIANECVESRPTHSQTVSREA
uniref:Putative ovule protein n=1 Tax=Solanum chacoense TaxID=4108 RepID=A0A0V0GI97_SOLCH